MTLNLSRILFALAAVVGFAQAGFSVLPMSQDARAIVAFGLGAAAVFLGALLKGPDSTPPSA